MSTNNLNTNNSASQTLFRFATTRNAELSDPKNKERRFIFRKEKLKGVFDLKLDSSTTLQKLCESPSTLPLTIETEQTLKAKDSVFYDLAIWVARNKATATKAEFDEKILEYKNYLITTKKSMLAIDPSFWDNLVYQVTTQKDFYAKETLMQFLHLNHILTIYTDGNEEVYKDVIKAKVVLPKELFKAKNTIEPKSKNSLEFIEQTLQKVPYDYKSMNFAEAKIALQANQNLASVINVLEKKYIKQYQEAYESALAIYDKETASARKEYQNNIAAQEYQKQLYIDIGNKEELAKLPYIPMPELPEFNFVFQKEVEESLLSQLSLEHQNCLNQLLKGASTSLENIETFAEINQLISQNNQILEQTILSNTVLNQQISTTLGGVVVPIANTVSIVNDQIPFSVKTIGNSWDNSTRQLLLTVDYFSKHIVSGTYSLKSNRQELPSSEVFLVDTGINILFNSSPKIQNTFLSDNEILELRGDVILNDGRSYTMFANMNIDLSSQQLNFLGTGFFVPKDKGTIDSGTGTPVDTTNLPFIPSGFGMKNIGITDYKKVEQSTYCYVEGDVAHIENIMAREYKERATRRLKRNESQTTKSSESEKEKLTDTTSTERHEMQSEISKILQESKDFAAQAGFSASWGSDGPSGKYGLNISANYATHNSKEESNRQAVTEAKDITARALDRIVTKVKEERIDKILEEYEENNKHGFDNTKGNNHVVGVYRWVDKVVKNQIYNYGKRMMFEFMIPEPAKLHSLGMKISKNTENQLIKPVDPRESTIHKMENFSALNNETTLQYWLSKFNVEIDEKPLEIFCMSKSFSGRDSNFGGQDDGKIQIVNGNGEIQLPEGYLLKNVNYIFNTYPHGFKGAHQAFMTIGGLGANWITSTFSTQINGTTPDLNIKDKLEFSFASGESPIIQGSLKLNLFITQEHKNAWLQKTFNKIIEAYQVELSKYEQALAEAKALGVQIKGSNPGFYRKIENTILRRNCISYMLEQNPSVELTFGRGKYYNNGYSSGEETFLNTDIKVDGKLDQYAAFVKFMEQAFEWEIMSYYFYPYYWGERKAWGDLYQFDDNDPIFRAFMQSGMARVIVTVRPGFEEAVRHFLATGQIWNGGEVPVIDDPLFLSIVDEMRSPKATKEGEPWREKIPTSLTILQADSIGLRVEKALPCHCEPGVKFDDNLGEMCGSNFELNDNQIGQTSDQWIEISFNEMDQLQYFKIIEDFDSKRLFPRKYECMGNAINIDRDANWKGEDSCTKMYKALADEISQIEGIEAYPTGENGITFKVLANKIKNFTFRKPGGVEEWDNLDFSIDLANDSLLIKTPTYNNYSVKRILDKNGQQLSKSDFLEKAPLSKFLV